MADPGREDSRKAAREASQEDWDCSLDGLEEGDMGRRPPKTARVVAAEVRPIVTTGKPVPAWSDRHSPKPLNEDDLNEDSASLPGGIAIDTLGSPLLEAWREPCHQTTQVPRKLFFSTPEREERQFSAAEPLLLSPNREQRPFSPPDRKKSALLSPMGRQPSDRADAAGGSMSNDIAAALAAQRVMLTKVLEAQDRHEAILQANSRMLVRAATGLQQRKGPASPNVAAAASPMLQSQSPQASCDLLGSVGEGIAVPFSPSFRLRRDASGELSAGVSGGSQPATPWDEGTPVHPSDIVPTPLQHTFHGDVSGNTEDLGISDAISMSTLDSQSRTTPPDETHNLDETLVRLRESGRNFFFWGLTNSDESQKAASQRSRCSMAAARLVHSVSFEVAVPMLIIANAAVIGYQADWDMQNINSVEEKDEANIFLWINRMFAISFFLEINLRIFAEGLYFFRHTNRCFGWNMFDMFIVASSVMEEVAQLVSSARRSRISSLRVVRVLRLVRALRVVRILRFFRELRIMVSGIMNCGKSLLWASLLIIIMTYIFAVVFLQITSSFLEDEDKIHIDCDEMNGTACQVRTTFPSLVWGMYTLFKAMSGGSSWGEVSDPLSSVHPVAGLAFCIYIMLAVFVVLNVITAIFVDAAARVSDDEATRILDNIQRKSVWIRNAKELFKILDTRQEGWLEWKDINRLFTDERCQSCLQEFGLDLDFQSTQVLFHLFDTDGRGVIHQDQFAKTLYRLHGSARSLDVARIHNTVSSMYRAIKDINKRVDALGNVMGLTMGFARSPASDWQTPNAETPMRTFASPGYRRTNSRRLRWPSSRS